MQSLLGFCISSSFNLNQHYNLQLGKKLFFISAARKYLMAIWTFPKIGSKQSHNVKIHIIFDLK